LWAARILFFVSQRPQPADHKRYAPKLTRFGVTIPVPKDPTSPYNASTPPENEQTQLVSTEFRIIIATFLVFLVLVFLAMNSSDQAVSILAPLAFLILYAGLFYGTFSICSQKGYPAIVSALVGLLPLLGLLVIMVMPDHSAPDS